MISSEATARHIRQVAGDPQVAQINLLRHQYTEISPGKHKKRKAAVNKQKQPYPRNAEKQTSSQFRRNLTPNLHTRIQIDAPSVVILFIERDSNAQQESSSASHATGLAIIQVYVTKEARTSKFPSRLGNLRHTKYRQVHCMHKIVPFMANLKIPV